MAFEIVDGMTGTKHISSDDLAALNTATVGKADCVLKYGNDFALTMASANSATLGTGVGMVGGKRFWNQAATSLTIQSGTQGQKRNDLVVARYAKTSAGIESITPVVVKGTPTTGTPADPATTANDLKLWRVPLNGITVGTPAKLFSPVTPLATLGDSVSQINQYPGRMSGNVKNQSWHVLPLGGNRVALVFEASPWYTALAKEEYYYKVALPIKVKKVLFSCSESAQWRCDRTRVTFEAGDTSVMNIAANIDIAASGGTVADPYLITIKVMIIAAI